MATTTLSTRVTGVAGVARLLREFRGPRTREELHRRWGIQTLQWIDENFRREGALTGTPWAKLKVRKGRILQDTGRLKNSFVMRPTATQVTVGSPVFYAKFHNEGRRGVWIIRPRKAKVLRFRNSKGQWVFAREVKHPGYPARRMLPKRTDRTYMDRLRRATVNFHNELRRR